MSMNWKCLVVSRTMSGKYHCEVENSQGADRYVVCAVFRCICVSAGAVTGDGYHEG